MRSFRCLSLLRHMGAWFASSNEPESLAVGGQAVMEGIMMRNGSQIALAIRRAEGDIVVVRKPWTTIFPDGITHLKWVRGFPVLIETMVNGIKALNISAEFSGGPESEKIRPWQLVLTLLVAIGLAFLLFVVVPHLLTIVLSWLSLSGNVEQASFHIWDGLIKFLMFVGYILIISQVDDIHRVFQYHGAEHKSIAAYEHKENPVTPLTASHYSRLHPRCGTTFMLFVIVISILLNTLSVTSLLSFWAPQNVLLKHTFVIILKFFLIIPISAVAYEAIRVAAKIKSPLIGAILRSPGLALQLLTTRTPDYSQLEVGLVALKEALGKEATVTIETPEYTIVERT